MHNILRFTSRLLCSLSIPALFILITVVHNASAAGTFAPVEKNVSTQGVSVREGLERAETRFTPEALTEVLLKSGSDDIKTVVSRALNGVSSRYEKEGSEFIVESVQPDKRGNTHARVIQQYKGVKVVAAEMNIIMNNERAVLAIHGFFAPALNIGIEPKQQPDDIIGVIGNDLQGDHEIINGPDLVIYGGRLAYSVIVAKKSERPSRWNYYIDASTGSILAKYSDIKY